MFRLNYRKVLAVVAAAGFVLMVCSIPAAAKKSAGKAASSAARSRPKAATATSSRSPSAVSRPSSAGRTRITSSAPSRSVRPPRATTSPGVPQTSRSGKSITRSRPTVSRAAPRQSAVRASRSRVVHSVVARSRITSASGGTSVRVYRGGAPTGISAVKAPSVSAPGSNRVSVNNASRIGAVIGQSRAGADAGKSGISETKISRIGTTIGGTSRVAAGAKESGGVMRTTRAGQGAGSAGSGISGSSRTTANAAGSVARAGRSRLGRVVIIGGKGESSGTGQANAAKVNIRKAGKAERAEKSTGKGRIATLKRSRIGQTIKIDRKAGPSSDGTGSILGRAKVAVKKTAKGAGSRVIRDSGSIVRTSKTGVAVHKAAKTIKQSGIRQSYGAGLPRDAGVKSPVIRKAGSVVTAGGKSGRQRAESRKAFEAGRAGFHEQRRLIGGRLEQRRQSRRFSRPAYRERAEIVSNARRHEQVYVDHHNRVRRTIVRPDYRCLVRYRWGGNWAFRWVYPYYHRRYVFVSLGGYWPVRYRYMRYYWYGCHPYDWYGYYPVAREVAGDTYNYYTYNYYGAAGDSSAEYSPTEYGLRPVDHSTFADVRARLEAEGQEPYEATVADRYFEGAVEFFEAGDYARTAEYLAEAMKLAPEDMVLVYAYSQALFAAERYTEAAEALRGALAEVSVEEEGVFYPRGLYTDEDILLKQIDKLAGKTELYSFDVDLHLLLGYQLLGIGELDQAVEPLRFAALDMENAPSATVLLSLLEKLRIQKTDNDKQ